MHTLLLVEDDKFTRHLLKEKLEQHDMLILEAISGKRSLEILNQHPVDVILLDLGLQDGNGLDFIPDIRKHSDAPIIIISADKNIASRITGLERGADDFVPKPFSTGELLARINRSLRRYKGLHENGSYHPDSMQADDKIGFGEWILDCAKLQIYDRNGNSGDLTAGEFQVLEMLIKNAGHALRREDLCQAVKVDNYVPTPRAIDVKISRIRKKIGDDVDDPQIIQTIRAIGYMFNDDMIHTIQ